MRPGQWPRYHAHMTARFRTLALVVPVMRARTGLLGRASRVMPDEEVEAHAAILRTVPAMVSAWSDGNADLDPFRVRVLDDVVMDRLDRYGSGWWPSPESQEQLLDPHVGRGRWDWCSSRGRGMPASAVGPGASPVGRRRRRAARATPRSPAARGHLRDRDEPAHGFVHEWLAPGRGGLPGPRARA